MFLISSMLALDISIVLRPPTLIKAIIAKSLLSRSVSLAMPNNMPLSCVAPKKSLLWPRSCFGALTPVAIFAYMPR